MAEARSKTDKSVKGLSAAKLIWPATKAFKSEMDETKKNHRVAWCGGGITAIELLYAFGYLVQHIDNMAAGFSAKQVSGDYILRAEGEGFPRDFCTYYKTVFGHLLSNIEDYPQCKVIDWPRPDILVGSNAVCITHARGIQDLQKRFNVPTFMFDMLKIPPRMDEHHNSPEEAPYEHSYLGSDYKHDIESQYLGYMVDQTRHFIQFLEGVTGQKADWGKIKEAVELSRHMSQLFYEIQDLRRAIPCPIGGADIMSLISPTFIWAGSHRGIDVYEQAIKEAKEKIARGEGAIPEEKFRLFFEAIPPWYSLGLFNYMQDRGGVSVIETYPIEFAYDKLDPDYPLESLANKQLRYLYNYSVRERGDLTLRLIKEYKVDGYVHWNVICCKQFAHFANYMRERCERELDVPGLVLDADQSDPRDYNDGVVKGRIDAFFELLESKKYG